MKNHLILFFFLLISCSSSAQDMEQIAIDQVDQPMKVQVTEMAEQILTGWNQGNFKNFDDENATAQFQHSFTQEVQKQAWSQISAMFGHFKGVELEQVWQMPAQKIIFFRYRGEFEKGNPEVRIVLNQEHKLAGLFIKPWQDKLQ
jgi:hypothetical protein